MKIRILFMLLVCYGTASAQSYTGASNVDPANIIELSPSASSATNESNIQTAINDIPSGGWIVLNDGVYLLELKGYTITKPINIVAKNRLGATITNVLTPATNYGQEAIPLTGSVFVFDPGSDGSSIQGINFENIRRTASGSFAYTAVARSDNFTFRHNVLKDGGDTNVLLDTGTANHLVEWNAFYNFMPNGVKPNAGLGDAMFNTEGTLWQYSLAPDQYSDYVLIMKGRNSIVRNNYFHGLFHQTISVAEKTPGTTVFEGNSFDGSALSSIIVGQGLGAGGSFSANPQTAPLIIKNNVWRAVVGLDGNEYNLRFPIRLSGFSGDITIEGNVIEGSAVPIRLECVNNPSSSCASGAVTITKNWLTASATNSTGQTNSDGAVIANSNFSTGSVSFNISDNVFINGAALGLSATVSFDNNKMINATNGSATFASQTGNVTCTSPAAIGSAATSTIQGIGPKILSGSNHPIFTSKTDYPSYYETACTEPDTTGLNRTLPTFSTVWDQPAAGGPPSGSCTWNN